MSLIVTSVAGGIDRVESIFRAEMRFAVGVGPRALAIGDVDADGFTDIVTANSGSSDVSLLLGRPGGTFALARSFPVHTGAFPVDLTDVLLADLNGDGHLDVVTGCTDSCANISVLFGEGRGAFSTPLSLFAGRGPGAVAVGEVAGTENLDLLAALFFNRAIAVLPGVGGDRFDDRRTFDLDSAPTDLELADVDGDGSGDLIVAASGDIVVSLNGPGGFGVLRRFGNGGAGEFSVHDVNGDGALDVVAASSDPDRIDILLGDGRGAFDDVRSIGVSCRIDALAVGDANFDGLADIVTSSEACGETRFFRGLGDEQFLPGERYSESLTDLVIGDVTGDGYPDIVGTGGRVGSVTVLRRNVTFSCPGDCDGRGSVSIDELIRIVRVALGDPLDLCPGIDADDSGSVSIAEVTSAVNASLRGCRPPPPVISQADGSKHFVRVAGVGDNVDGVEGLSEVESMVVSPDGRNVYAGGGTDRAIAVFSRDEVSGVLDFLETAVVGFGISPTSMGISATGSNLYLHGGRRLVFLERDPSNGSLAEVFILGRGGDQGPFASSPDGADVYHAFGSILGFRIDPLMDRVEMVDSERTSPSVDHSLAMSPDGLFLYAVGRGGLAVYGRDPATGTLDLVAFDEDLVPGFQLVAVSPDGVALYVLNVEEGRLRSFERDEHTGLVREIQVLTDGLRGACSIALTADDRRLFVAAPTSGAVLAFDRDESGIRIALADRIPFPESRLVAVSPDSRHLYVAGRSTITVFRDTRLDP